MTTTLTKTTLTTAEQPPAFVHRLLLLKLLCLSCLLGLCLGLAPAHGSVDISGQRYQKVSEVGSSFGMAHAVVTRGKRERISSQWSSFEVTLHQRKALLNGHHVHLSRPIVVRSGALYMAQVDVTTLLKPLLTPQVFKPVPKLYHIVIDPGHGGHDPGAHNPDLNVGEKATVLDLAKRLERKLEAIGYKVTLTRTEDRFMSLAQRASFTNRLKPDLFISLHFNAVSTPSVHGVETYIMTPQGEPSSNTTAVTASARQRHPGNVNDPWNALAGYYIQTHMRMGLGSKDRGLKRARFAVLRLVDSPAVLVEGGFVTHPQEGRNIAQAAYRDQMATAITKGILNYQRTLNRLRGR
jgi:N-acetylmuramoyl-L-alanine amidase